MPTGTKITGNLSVTGSLRLNTLSIGSDIGFTNLTETRIVGKKSLVLGQTGDFYGATYLTLQNRGGLNGAMFETTDPTVTLVDFGFKTGTNAVRYIRLEGRAGSAKCGANSFHIGGPGADSPCLAVGDTYSATTKLAIGSYTSPWTNALSVTGNTTVSGTLTSSGLITASAGMTVAGNVSMPGYLFCAGLVSATGTKLTSTGQVSYTVARLSGYPVGVWTITFASAHPLGANYIVTTSARGYFSYVSSAVTPTSTSFVFAVINPSNVSPVDGIFSFMVLSS